jgi:hypothetical protein
MNSLFGPSGRMFEQMKVLHLHYSTAVKIEDMQLFPLKLEGIFASSFMTLKILHYMIIYNYSDQYINKTVT